jgi:hypothetical protein
MVWHFEVPGTQTVTLTKGTLGSRVPPPTETETALGAASSSESADCPAIIEKTSKNVASGLVDRSMALYLHDLT